jgi:hypothetical protein
MSLQLLQIWNSSEKLESFLKLKFHTLCQNCCCNYCNAYQIQGLTSPYKQHFKTVKVEGTVIPLQAWTGPEVFQEDEVPRFQDNRHMKVVRLSALNNGRLYPPGIVPGTHFY